MNNKYFLFLIIGIFLISLASADLMNFDNYKEYDDKIGDYGKITILDKNLFGDDTKLLETTLERNTEVCSLGRFCEAEGTATLYEDNYLISNLRFELGNIYSYKIYIMEKGNWIRYNNGILPAGTYQWKIEGYKENGEIVDWVASFGDYDIEATEWALWTGTDAPKGYWSFDENTGTTAYDNASSNDAELVDGAYWGVGKLGSAVNFDNANDYVNVSLANNLQFNLTNEFTICSWVYHNNTGAIDSFISSGDSGSDTGYLLRFDATNKLQFTLTHSAVNQLNIKTQVATNTNLWEHICIVKNDSASASGTLIYINATSMAFDIDRDDLVSDTVSNNLQFGSQNAGTSLFFAGGLDEIGIWNRSLSSTEISDLYNNGAGLSFGSGELLVSLNSPTDNLAQITNSITFNTSSTTSAPDFLINNSLFINSVRNETSAISGISNETIFNKTFPVGSYTWYIESCSNDFGCVNSNSRSFIINAYQINSNTYDNDTIEGSTERFELNISLASGLAVATADLIFNDTAYVGSFTSTSNNYTISRSLAMPLVSANTNLTFFWNVTLDEDTTFNSSINNVTINNIAIDDCSSYTNVLLNYTLVDEKTQVALTTVNTSVLVDLDMYSVGDRSSPIIEYYNNFTNISNPQICLETALTTESYELDVETSYTADTYASEFYYIQNTSITNSTIPKNIILYDLSDDDAQQFIISYKDENFLVVNDALIQIQRKYINEGVYKTVEILKTDPDGRASASLEVDDAVYTIIITKNGKTLATFEDVTAICQNPSLSSCEINLNSFASSVSVKDYTQGDDFSFTLTYNNNTRIVQSVYTIPSGSPSLVSLNVTLFDSLGTNQACFDSLNSASGTLSCTVPNNLGNGTAVATIYKDGVNVGTSFIRLGQTPKQLYGGNIVFLFMFMMLTLIGVGMSDSPMITGIFLLLGMVLAIMFNLASGTFIGVGAGFLWLAIAVVIILIKGAKRT